MHFRGLDLNLLVALEALLTEQNVTRAAVRLNLSQSATSSALLRLRRQLDDELLVQAGRGFRLSPRAQRLLPEVRGILARIDASITGSCSVRPGEIRRHVRMMASDYVAITVLGPCVAALCDEAPGLTFNIVKMTDQPFRAIEEYEVDLLITSDLYTSRVHPSADFFTDDYVALGWAGGRWAAQPPDCRAFTDAMHISVRFEPHGRVTHDENVLCTLGSRKNTVVTVPGHALIPYFLVNTDRIAIVQRRLATLFISQFSLCDIGLPFNLPRIRETFQWHSNNEDDPVLQYIRQRLISIVKNV